MSPLTVMRHAFGAEMTAVLTEVNASDAEADAAWVEFIARAWPMAHRYRVLLALRRGEYGEAIRGLPGHGRAHRRLSTDGPVPLASPARR